MHALTDLLDGLPINGINGWDLARHSYLQASSLWISAPAGSLPLDPASRAPSPNQRSLTLAPWELSTAVCSRCPTPLPTCTTCATVYPQVVISALLGTAECSQCLLLNSPLLLCSRLVTLHPSSVTHCVRQGVGYSAQLCGSPRLVDAHYHPQVLHTPPATPI